MFFLPQSHQDTRKVQTQVILLDFDFHLLGFEKEFCLKGKKKITQGTALGNEKQLKKALKGRKQY